MKRFLSITVFLLLSIVINAQSTWSWARKSIGSEDDYITCSGTDQNGYYYVAGWYYSPTITFGSFTLTNGDPSAFSLDAFLVKYSSGGSVVWAKNITGPDREIINDLSVDASGNVYITGRFTSPTLTFGSFTMTNNSFGYDVFTVKYSSSGTVLWAKQYGTAGNEDAQAISNDINGNVYVGGYFANTITFGSITLNTTGLGTYLLKLDATGNELWAIKSSANVLLNQIDVDPAGDVFMTGTFTDSAFTIGNTVLLNDSIGTHDIYLSKFDTNGNFVWAKSVHSENQDYAYGITTDITGNVIITGNFLGRNCQFDTVSVQNSVLTGNDFFVAKYNGSGNLLWVKTAGGNYNEGGMSVCTDIYENIYCAGSYSGNNIVFSPGVTLTNAIGGNSNAFVVKYNSSGIPLWANGPSGNVYAAGSSVKIGSSQQIYFSGIFISSSVSFGSITLTKPSTFESDVFVTRLNQLGVMIEENVSENMINVYPNPGNGIFHCDNIYGEKAFVFDMSGKKIIAFDIKDRTAIIDLNGFDKGIYFLEVLSKDGEIKWSKLVLQ
ncbi:MAG: hypothetical protein K0S44_294 [Bacteroidetes bacterium]|jgi:hypothetical protein|nr:hypothetical protein [Bacteroidota bacterium]